MASDNWAVCYFWTQKQVPSATSTVDCVVVVVVVLVLGVVVIRFSIY